MNIIKKYTIYVVLGVVLGANGCLFPTWKFFVSWFAIMISMEMHKLAK